MNRLEGHSEGVTAAAFSLVATVSLDKTARLWDSKTGKEVTLLEGHGALISSAAFSIDNNLLVTASLDKTARLWDVKTGCLVRILVPLEYGWVSLPANGLALCEGEGGEVLTYYDPDEQEMPRTIWYHEDVKDLLAARLKSEGDSRVAKSAPKTNKRFRKDR